MESSFERAQSSAASSFATSFSSLRTAASAMPARTCWLTACVVRPAMAAGASGALSTMARTSAVDSLLRLKALRAPMPMLGKLLRAVPRPVLLLLLLLLLAVLEVDLELELLELLLLLLLLLLSVLPVVSMATALLLLLLLLLLLPFWL